MAKIVLDARTIQAEPTGVGRYSRALIPLLQELGGDRHEFALIRLKGSGPELGIEGIDEVFVNQRNDRLDHVTLGSFKVKPLLDELGADLYHSLFHVLPVGLSGVPIVMTMHDFIWVDHPDMAGMTGIVGRAEQAFWSRVIRQSLRQCDAVIHVSETTLRRAKSFLGDAWDAREHVAIHHGVAEHYFEDPPAPSDAWTAIWERGPVVACVGNSKPYKNLATVVDAVAKMERDDVQLVLIGRCDEVAAQAKEDLGDRLHLAGIVGDHDLHALVGSADVFVFPSLIEGFGMPPLEAMAMGTATITAARHPMLEVGTPGAEAFAPLDSTDLAQRLDRLLGDDTALAEAERRARAHASTFRWSETARKTLDVYDRLLG